MAKLKLLVIGAGPGGYPAAFLAADRGMEVTLVDPEERLGGVCLLRGCIPSKALLHVAKLLHETRQAAEWGLDFGQPRIDLERLRQWKDQVIGKLTGGLAQLNKQRGIRHVRGRARFVDSHTVEVDDKEKIRFDRCILATGSRPVMPGDLALESDRVMDSTGALALPDIPARLLVVGGGYIGLEMGTVYAALGSRVTVVEMTGGLLPGVDRDLVRILQARLKKDFEAIHLNTRVAGLKEESGGLTATLESDNRPPEEHPFDRVLVAVGRRPNSDGLGLENTRVGLDDRGFVQVDSRLQTSDPAISAIGDLVGGAMLAHKATHEARVAVEAIAGEPSEFDPRAIPAVVFTDPEIAWAGLTETQARAEDREVEIAKFPWGASGRATTVDRNDGLTKWVLEPKTRRILGLGLVGSGAGELIGEGVLALEMGAVAEDLAWSIHPHPTLSETLMEAAEVASGQAVHQVKRR